MPSSATTHTHTSTTASARERQRERAAASERGRERASGWGGLGTREEATRQRQVRWQHCTTLQRRACRRSVTGMGTSERSARSAMVMGGSGASPAMMTAFIGGRMVSRCSAAGARVTPSCSADGVTEVERSYPRTVMGARGVVGSTCVEMRSSRSLPGWLGRRSRAGLVSIAAIDTYMYICALPRVRSQAET